MLGGKMKGGEMSSISPLVSFMLGAAMATVCVLFFMSASPGGRLVDISAFTSRNNNNNGTIAQQHEGADDQLLSSLADGANDAAMPAPAPAPVEVHT
ncbi:hypothetical protein PR202_ga14157 [Eleusine coracana subsp. coracana]|uniref:Uncharacterized protein n=1 Tax=Eleusine coracana subsp. coracana TaxID=191504 RepID=A0AAV5CGG7_ELECO|nr:hypothetical protein PR202_ga14157 [Eleusine coracana subsp. coracana]